MIRKLIPQPLINYLWHFPIALAANLKYQFPAKKLTVIGVTGTDGKTTTANMLYHILRDNGYKVALISTVSAKIGDKEIDTGFHVTTPNPFLLQKLLKQMLSRQITHVVLETTSHGLDQFRLWGIPFYGGIVTNINYDHLDYHKTWDNYLNAKAELFSHTQFAILNREDKSYAKLLKKAKGKIISYGEEQGDYNLDNTSVKINTVGIYNQLNGLAALSAAVALGISKDKALASLATFTPVKGRMQIMQKTPFLVVVDFAHTPNGLKNALTALRLETKGRIIAVFGCAGLRDVYRRRMGEVAANLADITIITAEDPREEGVEKISNEIEKWAIKGGAIQSQITNDKLGIIKNKHFYIKIPDRREAIEYALKLAQTGDIVGIFGKGHEQSMCFGNTEMPWSDQETVKNILNN